MGDQTAAITSGTFTVTGTPIEVDISNETQVGLKYHLLRKKFVELSGRYDLITTSDEDNGADFFINAGQQFLDRMQDTGKMKAKFNRKVTAGTIKVYTNNLRAVLGVWAGNSTEGLVQLTHYPIDQIRAFYEEQLSSIDQGMPIYYCPAVFRPVPDAATASTFTGHYDVDDLILPDPVLRRHHAYNGILIAPPPDEDYYISIYGLFYNPALSAKLDSNGNWEYTRSFWTDVFPDILLKAALYQLETFYRNTEGAKDWMNALTIDVAGMDKDAAEEESAGVIRMEG